MFSQKKSKWSKIIGYSSEDRSFGINAMGDGSDRVSYEMYKNTIGKKNSAWLRKAELSWLFGTIQAGEKKGELEDKDKTRALVLSVGLYGEYRITVSKPAAIHGGVTTTVLEFSEVEMKELQVLFEKLNSVNSFDVLDVTVEQLTDALLMVWTNRELVAGMQPLRVGAYLNDALAKLTKVLPPGNCPAYPINLDVDRKEIFPIPKEYVAICLFMENLLVGLGF